MLLDPKLLQFHLNAFIATMQWTPAATEHEKSLVLGNLNGLVAFMSSKEQQYKGENYLIAEAERCDNFIPKKPEPDQSWERWMSADRPPEDSRTVRVKNAGEKGFASYKPEKKMWYSTASGSRLYHVTEWRELAGK